MEHKLGKTPARPGAIKFKFAQVFDKSELPVPPPVFGHEPQSDKFAWGVLGNNDWSDCVFAGAAHETMVWSHEAKGDIPVFSESNVLADYGVVTGFDPSRPETDQGTDLQQAAEYRRTTGIRDRDGGRHKIDAYVALRAGNIEQLALATYIMGAAGLGLEMPSSAMDQFDAGQPWSVVKGSHIEAGHYVPCVGRNSAGNFLIVTWGRLHAVTPSFITKYSDECVGYLSFESLGKSSRMTPEGFDEAGLRKMLRAITR